MMGNARNEGQMRSMQGGWEPLSKPLCSCNLEPLPPLSWQGRVPPVAVMLISLARVAGALVLSSQMVHWLL